MKKWINWTKGEVFVHLLIWSLLYLMLLSFVKSVDQLSSDEHYLALPLFTGFVFSLVVFYGNSEFLAPKVARQHKWLNYFGLSVILVALVSSVETLVDAYYYDFVEPDHSKVLVGFVVPNITVNALVWGVSYAYWLTKSLVKAEKRRNQLAEERLLMEMTSLKASVNPHFLFNALNMVYAEALKSKKDAIADMVSKLASLMRYMVYETGAEKIDMETEVSFIKDYLKIWESRVGESSIQLHINENYPRSFMIPPMLLLPLIENACKHGHSADKYSRIEVNLIGDENGFSMEVINDCVAQSEDLERAGTGGFGLKNLKERLTVLYPHQHELSTWQDEDKFFAKLALRL